ncbi:hypothetical protein ACN93P_002379 [Citrobacter freundii]
MNVYEMEGFLRGKCLPGDMKVNESDAQYLVRKFSELQSQNAELAVQLANAERKCRELDWIEGNEPAEFGRYWVRYETDVGPQYCSAKWMEHNFCAGSNTNIHKIWLADHSRSINSLCGVTHYTKLPDSLEGAAQ